MEITNEIKAKVFAQYLGHNGKYKNEDFVYKVYQCTIRENYDEISLFGNNPEYIGTTFTCSIGDFKLILKPLSAITDEDAIEVAKICNCGNWTIKRKLEYKKTTYNTPYAQLYTEYKDKKQVLINFDNNGFKVHYGNEYYDTHVPSYQFLQSKGYDLPHYLLGGKTLQEAGLAIYE